ncbi:MAG: hypothetical protein ABGY41_14830 [Candidatus Poribacteria bacterium]
MARSVVRRPGRKQTVREDHVHHGTRESVEVFEVDADATPPALTWVGCAPALSTLSTSRPQTAGPFTTTFPSRASRCMSDSVSPADKVSSHPG